MKNTLNSPSSDIRPESWIEKLLPVVLHPYSRLARLDRPIGTWLLLLPCLFSTVLASDDIPDSKILLLFICGAIIMRGAGCTLNDIIDRDFDKNVDRTATRPIPSGSITVQAAIVFLFIQLFAGLIILVQFDFFAILIGCLSLPIIIAYPFAKRVTNWPQLCLGIVFNWGAILGWAVVTGEVGMPAIFLYVGGIAWTLGYDTIYAHQDREDDVLIGVKSTALNLITKTKAWIFSFFVLTIILFGLAGWTSDLSWPFYFGLTLAFLHSAWQVVTLDVNHSKNCLTRFKSNRDFGLLLLASIICGKL